MKAIEKYELKADLSRWQWAYWTGYATAFFNAIDAFILQDNHGNYSIGFDLGSSIQFLLVSLAMTAITWGIHKRVSLFCTVGLFLISLFSTVWLIVNLSSGTELLGSAIVTALLFRGAIGVRNLRKFKKEYEGGLAQRGQVGDRQDVLFSSQ